MTPVRLIVHWAKIEKVEIYKILVYSNVCAEIFAI